LLLTSLTQQRERERQVAPAVERERGSAEHGRGAAELWRWEERTRDMTRSRERPNVPQYVRDLDQLREQDIYGSQLMSALERSQYRERLRLLRDDSAWARMQARHQDEMRVRARQRGVELPPPVYGQHLMTSREQAQHREQLANATSERARAELRARQISAVQARARQIRESLPAPFYGQQLMTDVERERLAERLRAIATERERERIRAEHREAMQARARQYQVPIEDLDLAGSQSLR
jgi:hypothetical protein